MAPFLISSGSKKKGPRHVCVIEATASLRLKILMTSGSKKGTHIYFALPSKSRQTSPRQVPPTGPPYREGGPFTGHFAYLSKPSSYGFPSKGAVLKVPFMDSLTERCPTTRALHSSIKIPGIRGLPPKYQDPLGWKGDPMERDARIRRLS